MGIKLGICGTGSFADCFIPLFRAHPLVDEVTLCDLDPAKLQAKSAEFEIPRTSPSLDDLCRTDVDAVAIFTQNWAHGPQALQALRSGKHVYSAVPSAIDLGEMKELVRAVEETGLAYVVGETSYYYPCTIYCRDRFKKGDFGEVVYGEAEYYHDFDHGLYEVFQQRGGDDWKKYAGSPPMHYPTHSTSMIVSVTGARMTHVSCMGFRDHHEDGLFGETANLWENPFSNETALFQMSDGSTCRINEFRRIGHPGANRMSLYGTIGSYEEQYNSKIWVTKDCEETVDLTESLRCRTGASYDSASRKTEVPHNTTGGYRNMAENHPIHRLPEEYRGLTNGHEGSHQFLVDDFVKACAEGGTPPNNVWDAARYLVPGLIAHESALKGGELLEIPDFGARNP